MPRLVRLDAPRVLHHVIRRDIERRKIFLDAIDRSDFIHWLAVPAEGDAIGIYACGQRSTRENYV